MLFGKCRKKVCLPGDIVMHWDHDRRLHLVDHLDDIFETEIRHGVDGNHHHIDPLQDLDLFLGQQMADVSQVRETQASHLENKNRVRDCAPTLTALARNVDDRDIFDGSSDRVPSLFKGDASKNDRIPHHSSGIIMREMIIDDRYCVGLNSRCNIEVRLRDDFGFTSRVNQEAGMSIPLHEEGTEGWASSAAAPCLKQVFSLLV